MATQHGPLAFSGSLSDLTFYRRKDGDKIFVRQKSGPTRKQMLYDKRFSRNRQMATEWNGCTLATKWVRRLLHPLGAVRDYNFVSSVNALFKTVQKLDTEGEYGRRSIQLSRYPHLLEGFIISRRTPFDTLLRTPLLCSIDKGTHSARIVIPELLTGLNFQPPTPHPYFRFVASLGVVPDIHHTPKDYAPGVPAGCYLPQVVRTEWMGVQQGLPQTSLQLQLPYTVEYPAYSLVLAIAVSFGSLDALGQVQAVTYTGSGRIAMVL